MSHERWWSWHHTPHCLSPEECAKREVERLRLRIAELEQTLHAQRQEWTARINAAQLDARQLRMGIRH